MGMSTRDPNFLGFEDSGYRIPTHGVSYLLTPEQRAAGLRLVEDAENGELCLRQLGEDGRVVRYVAQFDMASIDQALIREAADMWLASRAALVEVREMVHWYDGAAEADRIIKRRKEEAAIEEYMEEERREREKRD